MELRQIRQFVAVAEEASFTRAAGRCHIVQSALSKSIRLLEEELGAKLFIRTTRRVSLTAAGSVFLESARRALKIIDVASVDVADVMSLHRGRLSIGTVQSLPPFMELPALLSRFNQAHPGVEVRLIQGRAVELNEKVNERELDLAILPSEESDRKLVSHVIACDEMVLVCNRGHVLASKKTVSLERLAREGFVDFERGQGTRRLVDSGFAEMGLQRRVAFEISDLDTLLGLVDQGLGVALLPRDIVVRRQDSLVTVSLRGIELCWELVVVHAADGNRSVAHYLDPAPATFLEMLMEGRH
jgi:DNA-binding transcriptional LysR family regulator